MAEDPVRRVLPRKFGLADLHQICKLAKCLDLALAGFFIIQKRT